MTTVNGAAATIYKVPSNLTRDEVNDLTSDERFRYRIRQMLEYKARGGDYDIKSTDDIGLYNWIITQRREYRFYMNKGTRKESLLTKERVEQLTKIGFDWRYPETRLTASWLEWYERLKQYAEKHGHTRVQPHEDKALHKWVANQRQAYSRWKRGVGPSLGMTQDRFDKLEAIGMVWSARDSGVTVYDAQWQKRLQELVAFYKQHGHFVAPRRSPLGEWIAYQRKEYRDKQKYNVSHLSDEREAQLRKIGFDFDGRRTWMTERWMANLRRLQEFYKKHNHTSVPPSESTLRNWVDTQRGEYKRLKSGKRSSMTQHHIDALQAMDFCWDVRTSRWMEQYQKLLEFYKANNSASVPSKYPKDQAFANWVVSQRYYYRRAKHGETPVRLSEKQMRLLDDVRLLDADGNARKRRNHIAWSSMLDELSRFKSVHGHCRVPQQYSKNLRLGTWVMRQRALYRMYQNKKPSAMTPERIKALEEVGFEWVIEKPQENDFLAQRRNEMWHQRLEELQQFYKENGHFAVPGKYPKLKTWVRNTIQQYRRFKNNESSTLNAERVDALNALGFEQLLNGVTRPWESFLEDLMKFRSEHSHCRVPYKCEENPELARWVCRQRSMYKNLKKGKPSNLTPERIKTLEELGFEWSLPRGRQKGT